MGDKIKHQRRVDGRVPQSSQKRDRILANKGKGIDKQTRRSNDKPSTRDLVDASSRIDE